MSHLILIAHGSKDSKWRKPFEKMSDEIGKEVGAKNVSLCYMGSAEPSLEKVVEKAVKNKVSSFKVLPLFMAGGGHVDKDIPEQIAAIKEKHSNIDIKLLGAIGEHPLIYGAIKEVAKSYVSF